MGTHFASHVPKFVSCSKRLSSRFTLEPLRQQLFNTLNENMESYEELQPNTESQPTYIILQPVKQDSHTSSSNSSTNVPCEECGKSFASTAYLKQHITRIHVNHKKYQCDICSMRFSDNFYVIKHRKKFHQAELDDPQLRDKTDFKIRNVSGSDLLDKYDSDHSAKNSVNSAKCDTCGKSFSCATKVKRHYYAIHLNYSPFKCNLCTKAFNQKTHLEDHLVNKHSYTKEQSKAECKPLKFSLKEAEELFPEAKPNINNAKLLEIKDPEIVSTTKIDNCKTISDNIPPITNIPTSNLRNEAHELIPNNDTIEVTKDSATLITNKYYIDPSEYPKIKFKCKKCIYEFRTSDDMIDHYLSAHVVEASTTYYNEAASATNPTQMIVE